MKLPELSEESAGTKILMLRAIPTAPEAAEVDLRPDGRSPGILPYREKSAAARNSKFKITKHDIHHLHRYDWFIYIFYGLI